MVHYFLCTKCNKILQRSPVKIKDTWYVPESVSHNHGRASYMTRYLYYNEAMYFLEKGIEAENE